MRKAKVTGKNEKDSFMISVINGTVATNKRGFVPCFGHPMYMASININYVKKYYNLPPGIRY